MKKYNLKMLVLGLVASILMFGCVVHNQEYRHRYHYRNYHDHDHRDYDRHY